MCQIQIIQKLGKEKINKLDIGEFFKMMCFGSMDNNDAFGVFNNNYMFKRKGAFNASKLDEDDLIRSNFIIGHNRFSTSYDVTMWTNNIGIMPRISEIKKTSRVRPMKWDWSSSFQDNMSNIFLPNCQCGLVDVGDEKNINNKVVPVIKKKITYDDINRNHHPFELGCFTLIHNGTISNVHNLQNKYNFHTTIETDSYIILELINYFFKRSRIRNRIKRISAAIKKTCSKLRGSYSVLLYDNKGKNTFYFKNMFTSFYLCKYGEDILCGSTVDENLDYLYFGLDRQDIDIRSKRIYLITSDKVSPVVDVTPSSTYSSISWKNILDKSDFMDMEERVCVFLKKQLGFLPYYKITWSGNLKISRNNTYGIREKICKIVENPKERFGWYIIKSSDINPMIKKRKKIKLDKLKGGKK